MLIWINYFTWRGRLMSSGPKAVVAVSERHVRLGSAQFSTPAMNRDPSPYRFYNAERPCALQEAIG